MDIREKIARELCRLDGWCLESLNPQYISPQYNNPTQSDYYRKADQILALIKEAGYGKTEGKPPVLSDKEIEKLWRPIFVAHGFSGIYEASRAIAQAQLDKVIRFYEKEI